MMGLAREDLVYDVGRHVDNSVHLLEEWGLPIWKQENGQYERIGRWQIPIHGESIKPIAAEPARAALGPENIYERVAITHLLKDDDDPDKIAGAVGFSVRDNKFYVLPLPRRNHHHRRRIQRIPAPLRQRGPRSHLVLSLRNWLGIRPDDSRRRLK